MLKDQLLSTLADYVLDKTPPSALALETARYCLMDALGCGILALNYPACTKLLGPIIPLTEVPNGVIVPGTHYKLDPILAAFNITTLIRWLDYNDTWLAKEWGHPSDNIGAILAVTDYLNKHQHKSFTMHDILLAMVKAYEIQGIIALQNSFNRLGFDHVILVKIASCALSAYFLTPTRDAIENTLSQAFIDVGPLRLYRHAPNTGSRKSWAAGDACSRGLKLAWLTYQGEMGYKTPLSAAIWGFNENILRGNELILERTLSDYVMENILFKVSYPAEFHAQTAVEAAILLHAEIKNRIKEIDYISISTHESALRIISKKGALNNPADRDHCLEYMVACALLFGDLKAEYYENKFAENPRIDTLRALMRVSEDPTFSKDYLLHEKRSIANAIQIYFKNGTSTDKIAIEYPLGHRARRQECLPFLFKKFNGNLNTQFKEEKSQQLLQLFQDPYKLHAMPVDQFLNLWKC